MKFYILILFTLQALLSAEVKELDFHKETQTYTIKIGESLARIALDHKVSVSYLLSINTKIRNPNIIYSGQRIKVPNNTAIEHISKKSKTLRPLFDKLGAVKSKERINAVKEMIKQDWRVIPLLLEALKEKDPEVRENAREALREIHRSKARAEKLVFTPQVKTP